VEECPKYTVFPAFFRMLSGGVEKLCQLVSNFEKCHFQPKRQLDYQAFFT